MKHGRFASDRIAILSLLLLTSGWLALSQSPVAGQKSKTKPAAKPAVESKDREEPEVNSEGKVVKTEAEWRKLLTKQQFRVTRQKDTEQPFNNAYWKTKKDGTYQCVCCKLELFDSETKFDSGTGWPSFWQPVEKDAVSYEVDNTEGVPRTEVLCRRCDAHLGHVFADGPAPTGQRYCMNSASLKFVDRVKVEKKADPPGEVEKVSFSMSWWKHAFALEPDRTAQPTPEQQAVIDDLCQRVVNRGMALPAILFLESSKPLGPMAAQSLLLLQPWFELVADREQLETLTKFLDRRGSFDYLCQRMEQLSAPVTTASPEADGLRPVGS